MIQNILKSLFFFILGILFLTKSLLYGLITNDLTFLLQIYTKDFYIMQIDT